MIKHGTTRYVFLTKKYAIKIPQFKYEWRHFLLGLLANIQEVEFNNMNDERLCPIVFYIPGGWLVVMPYCPPITYDEFNNLDILEFFPQNKVTVRYSEPCNSFNIPVELKRDSFGWYKGKIVAIDYGS